MRMWLKNRFVVTMANDIVIIKGQETWSQTIGIGTMTMGALTIAVDAEGHEEEESHHSTDDRTHRQRFERRRVRIGNRRSVSVVCVRRKAAEDTAKTLVLMRTERHLKRRLSVRVPNAPLTTDDAVAFTFADPFIAVKCQTLGQQFHVAELGVEVQR